MELLVHQDGNFVNNYTPAVFRARILRQQSISAIQPGISLIVNENHNLVRFQLLVCYDRTQIFQPTAMTSVDWQAVISLKARLTYNQQQEVSMVRAK